MAGQDPPSTSSVDIGNVDIGMFRGLNVTNRTIVIDLKSIYGISALRDSTTTNGSATVSNTDAEYKLSTTSSGSDSALLESAERGRYQAGTAAECGIGVRRPTAPSNSQVLRWGYFDDENGFFFGEDSNGLFVARRRGGTDTTTQQSEWNVDPLDGTGPSGLSIDPSDGNIYQIRFAWYGYGVIEYRAIIEDPDNVQKVVTVHRERLTGQTSVNNPNLPISAEVDNGGTGTAMDLFVAGRQFSILGQYEPKRRITSERVTGKSISSTLIPVISFKPKTEFPTGTNNGVSNKFDSISITTDNDILWELRLDASLTDASFGTPTNATSSETSLESDTSATALSGGELLNAGLASGGARNATQLLQNDFRFDLPEDGQVTLAMQRAGSTDATVSTILKMREEW